MDSVAPRNKSETMSNAPDKIYFQVDEDWTPESGHHPFQNAIWSVDRVNESDVEYKQVSDAATPQPHPVLGRENVVKYVLEDLRKRREMGIEKYGTELQTHNGRMALWDAYQEMLDMVIYLRQYILEQAERG